MGIPAKARKRGPGAIDHIVGRYHGLAVTSALPLDGARVPRHRFDGPPAERFDEVSVRCVQAVFVELEPGPMHVDALTEKDQGLIELPGKARGHRLCLYAEGARDGIGKLRGHPLGAGDFI